MTTNNTSIVPVQGRLIWWITSRVQAAIRSASDAWITGTARRCALKKAASFKINRRLNRRYNPGTGKGGNIIDFAILLNDCTIAEWLQSLLGDFSFHKPLVNQRLIPCCTGHTGTGGWYDQFHGIVRKDAEHRQFLKDFLISFPSSFCCSRIPCWIAITVSSVHFRLPE